MLRLFLDRSVRWIVIGVVAIFAIGAFPGIASACEGAGEEGSLESEVEKEENGLTIDLIVNPYNREIELTTDVRALPRRGAITNIGSCKRGNRIAARGHCSFEQDPPPGGEADFRIL